MSIPKMGEKEISLGTKASPAKDSLSEKLSRTKRLLKPCTSFVLSLKYNKKQYNFYKYILYIIVTPLCFNK